MNEVFTETTEGINASVNQLEATCITSKTNKFHLDSEGNLSVNSITTVVDNSTSQVVDFSSIYPIGSIYMNITLVDPTVLFGGTWERIEGSFLLGANSVYSAGTRGGEAQVTLNVSQMPEHTHTQNAHCHNQHINTWINDNTLYDTQLTGSTKGYYAGAALKSYATEWATATNNKEGGNQPHNNMPPYLAVYMWKRVA